MLFILFVWRGTLKTLRFSGLDERNISLVAICAVKGFAAKRHLAQKMMHFDITSWSQHGRKMALCRFIYGAIIE